MRSLLLLLASALVVPCLAAGCGDGGSVPGDAGTSRDAGARDAAMRDASADTDAATDDAGPPAECPPPPTCDVPLPDLGATEDWRHTLSALTASSEPRHRGRDLILREGDPQWALAKFAYGVVDDDLQDEDVDLYLLRGCAGSWELLGTVATTNDGDHATVEGVEDTGGRVYYELPAAARLGVGRHRIAFVVRGDHTIASQYIEVLPASARFVVTDVDGTQTESETAAWGALFTGAPPAAQPYGADVLWAFSSRGYHVFYLTARPDWLAGRTHEWLDLRGYPPGIVHTTLGATGETGAPAQAFKTAELAQLEERFPGRLDYTIGNTDTDAAAFASAGVPPERSYLYQFDPGAIGTRVDDYSTLLAPIEALTPMCD